MIAAADIEACLHERLGQGEPDERAAVAIALAAVLRNRGHTDAAHRLLWEAASVTEPGLRARAWLALAEHLAESGEESGARRAYGRVAELADPELTPDVTIDLAARAEANGNPRGAAALYAEVFEADPGPTLRTLAALRLAALHRAEGEPRLALTRLEAVEGAGEGELAVEAELALAELLLELAFEEDSLTERAESLLASVIEVDHPDHSPRAALILARRLGARRSFSRAYELLVAVMSCEHPELSPRAETELSALIERRPEAAAPPCLPAAVPDHHGLLEEPDAAAPEAGAEAELDPVHLAAPLLLESLGGRLLACRMTEDIDRIQLKARLADPPAIAVRERRGHLFTISYGVDCQGEPDILPTRACAPFADAPVGRRPTPFAGIIRRLRVLLAPPAVHDARHLALHHLLPAVDAPPAPRAEYRYLLAALRALGPGEFEELLGEPAALPSRPDRFGCALLLAGLVDGPGLDADGSPSVRGQAARLACCVAFAGHWAIRVDASSTLPMEAESSAGRTSPFFATDLRAAEQAFEVGFARRPAAPPASPWSPGTGPPGAGLISAG